MVEARSAHWIAVRRHAVPVVVVLLLVGGIAARAAAALGGFLTTDDFSLAQRAITNPLSLKYLLTPWNNHVMPGGFTLYWVFGRLTGMAYWPYVVVFLVGQTAAAVVFYRLLRRLLGPGWMPVVALAMFQFTAITFENTAWVVTGVVFVPAQLATVWALSAQERYIATRRRRHLASLGAALVFGLCFFEKSLAIVVLVALFTACFYASGGPWRSLWSALRDYWPSWAVLGGLSLAYVAVYASLSSDVSSVRVPYSLREVAGFFVHYFGYTLVPGLVGGPLAWVPSGLGPATVATPVSAVWVSLVIVAAVVTGTVARRPAALRAWTLLAAYAGLSAALIAATRLGQPMSFLYGLMPRFGSDVVPVAALCLAVAVAGMAGDPPPRPLPRWVRTAPALALGSLVAVAIVVATAVSDVRMAQVWSINVGRDYLRALQAEVAAMPADTRYFDRLVPEGIIWAVAPVEERWQSGLLAADKGPRMTVVSGGEEIFVIDDDAHARPIAVSGPAALPGPDGCGWQVVDGGPVAIALDGAIEAWFPAARIDYSSTTDTTATLSVGGFTQEFPVRAGEHHYYLRLDAGVYGFLRAPAAAELSVRDPSASLCVGGLTIGEVVAAAGQPPPVR